MEDNALQSLRERPAADICRECDLEDDHGAALAANPDAAAFLRSLLGAGAARDAVRFLAHALSPKYAVWWGAHCVGTLDVKSMPADAQAAFAATHAWLVDPKESQRRAAQAAADRCGIGLPAGCLALSVFLAEGSLGPPDLAQEVPVPPFACAKAVAGAVLLASVRVPERAQATAIAFVESWNDLAQRPPPWGRPGGASASADTQPQKRQP